MSVCKQYSSVRRMVNCQSIFNLDWCTTQIADIAWLVYYRTVHIWKAVYLVSFFLHEARFKVWNKNTFIPAVTMKIPPGINLLLMSWLGHLFENELMIWLLADYI